MTLKQIIDYKLGWDINGIIDDGSDIIDLIYVSYVQKQSLDPLDWAQLEEEDLDNRIVAVLRT